LAVSLAEPSQAAQDNFLLRRPAGIIVGDDYDDDDEHDMMWQECGQIRIAGW